MTAFLDPPRLRFRSGLAAAGLLALMVAPGCGDDSETEAPVLDAPTAPAQLGELASLSFEAVAYVEPSANNITVLDRIRHEVGSVFSGLQLRQIIISQRRQVDVDLKRLSREPITVVDPVTHTGRPAVRVRYRYVGLATVPREIGLRREALLTLLHRDDAAHAAEVLEACTSPAARTGDAVKQPWRIFNPALAACALAVDAEQTKIDEARVGLEHPDREIVPIERDRVYLPVVLHLRLRASAGAAGSSQPGANGSASRPGAAPAGTGGPAVGSDAPIDVAAMIAERREARLLAKLKEAEKVTGGDDDDEREVAAILARRGGGGLPGGEGGPRAPFLGYGGEMQPVNYTLLWFTGIAVIALLGTEIRRRLLRRDTRRTRR